MTLKQVANTDWVMGVAADEEAVLAPVTQLIWLIAGGVVIVLLVLVALSSGYLTRLLRGLIQVRDAMSEIAQGEGDLTRRIDIHGEDEVAQTAEAFNQFVGRLNGMFRELRGEAEELAHGVIEVGGAVKQVASDSHRLADISSSNAAAIEEVTVSISHIAEATRETDSLARNTGEHSRESAGDMQRISSEMEQTSQSVSELSALLASLEQRSQEISKITNVISDIADQTNLLALNAAIEARAPASRAAASPWWPTKCASWPSAPARRRWKSAKWWRTSWAKPARRWAICSAPSARWIPASS
ncbi:H3 [Chromobacterium violaceum]|uniref:H3 n=1 Tax=Chromobacterium violaceum TaxID=536 RepID=A0A3S4HNV3_CHRVL|nr:H3 [Chromobacterium violaceum]